MLLCFWAIIMLQRLINHWIKRWLLTYPFRHLPSVGIMVVELQNQDCHHHRQAHDHHGTSKVLSWREEEHRSKAGTENRKILVCYLKITCEFLMKSPASTYSTRTDIRFSILAELLPGQSVGLLLSGEFIAVNKPEVITPQGLKQAWLTFYFLI